jgi:thiamine biosynthesis lipoprotein
MRFQPQSFSLAPKKVMSFVEQHKNIEAIFVDKDSKVYVSKNLKERFEIDKKSEYQLGDIADLK